MQTVSGTAGCNTISAAESLPFPAVADTQQGPTFHPQKHMAQLQKENQRVPGDISDGTLATKVLYAKVALCFHRELAPRNALQEQNHIK